MKPKTLILMVVAVTCGLGASYMTSRLLAERSPDSEEQVNVLVAKKNLDQGTTIKNVDDLFQVKQFARGKEPKEAILNVEDLKGRVLRRFLRQDDHVTASDLLSADQAGISSLMSQGYRAFGIRLSLQDIASGFACTPLSRVDMLWTVRRATDKDSFCSVLLENVLVLAADQQTRNDENGRPMPANIVTVALKPEDAQKVAMAREMGTVSFVLRKFNDHSKSEVEKTTVEEILTGRSGRKDIEENGWTVDTAQPSEKRSDLPKLDGKDAIPIQVAEAPKGTLHRLRIIEGDKERVVEYWLGDDEEVIHNEVRRTELTPPNPPRPPQPQPPQPQQPMGGPPESPR